MKDTLWLLDSGAFSAKHSGAVISIEEYANFVKKYRDIFDGGAINLDVIGNREASYTNWLKLRDLGVDTIPVFHLQPDDKSLDDRFKYLDLYMEKTNHIAIGGVARLSTEQRIYGFDNMWDYLEQIGATKTHRFHGLGMTSIALMTRYPWYSMDSATAIKHALNGAIFVPRLMPSGEYDYLDSRQYRVSDQGEHVAGSVMSFFSLPHGGRLQSHIRHYCNELGYTLPETIEGRVLRPRKSRPGENREHPFSLDLSPAQTETNGFTLANDYKMRESHNFAFFNRLVGALQSQGRKMHLFTVMGSPPQYERYFERAAQDKVRPTILVSYYVLKTRHSVARLVLGKEVESGNSKRQTANRSKGSKTRSGRKGTR